MAESEVEKIVNLEIDVTHLRGQLEFNKVILLHIQQMVTKLLIDNDKMLDKTEVKE